MEKEENGEENDEEAQEESFQFTSPLAIDKGRSLFRLPSFSYRRNF